MLPNLVSTNQNNFGNRLGIPTESDEYSRGFTESTWMDGELCIGTPSLFNTVTILTRVRLMIY